MAINLVADVMKMATPAIIDKIATSFGLNASMVQSVLATAVPSIFASVSTQAASPSGLGNLMSSLAQVNPNLSSSLMGSLSGGANNPMVTAGSSMLSSVLGAGGLNAIVSNVTKSSGASAAAATGLVGLAGQMAMSTLAQHTAGLDAAGVGKLLSSQAGQFSASMPSMGSAASTMQSAARSTAASASNTASQAASSGTNWLMYLIPAAVVAAGLYYFMGMKGPVNDDKPVAQVTTQQAAPAPAPAATAMMIDNIDVSKSLTDSVTGLTTAIAGVTDPTSAQAAVAKIADASKGIATVSGLAAKFTPAQKATVGAMVGGLLPALTAAVTKAEAIPGVGDLLKPAIGPVLDQLTALTK